MYSNTASLNFKDLSLENSKYQKTLTCTEQAAMDLLYYKKSSVDYFFCIIIEVNQPSKNTTWNNGNNFSSLFSPSFLSTRLWKYCVGLELVAFFQVQELSLPLIASKCTPGAFHTLSISGAFFQIFIRENLSSFGCCARTKKAAKNIQFPTHCGFFLLLSQVNFQWSFHRYWQDFEIVALSVI